MISLTLTRDAAITDVAMTIIIVGTVVFALTVDVAAAVEWLRNRRR
jgi:hypothetical protein